MRISTLNLPSKQPTYLSLKLPSNQLSSLLVHLYISTTRTQKQQGTIMMETLIFTSLYLGMWWILPLLATSCALVRREFVKGTWAKTSRISFKVKGACNLFRMAIEAKKIPTVIVDHVLSHFPLTRENFKAGVIPSIRRASTLFKKAKNIPMWSLEIADTLLLARLSCPNIFAIFQCGCILMHHGLGDTWVFQMMEIQMDILIQPFCREAHSDLPKITFRGVIMEILSHPIMSKRFLSSFDYIPSYDTNSLAMIPQYRRVLYMLDFSCSWSNMVTCFNRMPRSILASIAYLVMMSLAHHPYVVVQSTRRNCKIFNDYLQRKGGDVCVSGKWKVVRTYYAIFHEFQEEIDYAILEPVHMM